MKTPTRTTVALAATLVALAALAAPTPGRAQSAGTPPTTTEAQTPPPAGDGADTMAQSTAREQDLTDQQARAHFAVGRAMYDAGRFAEAASEFQQAYDLSHRPQLLYNLYIAYRDSSQLVRARDALRQYLMEVTDVPNRLHLVSRLEALETQIAQEERAHAESEAELAAAEQAAADAEMARQRAEAEAANLRHVRPWWPWLLVGAGVVLGGVGAGLAAEASSRGASILERCTPTPAGQQLCRDESLLAGRQGVLDQALAGDILWITGAVIGLTGLGLAFGLPDDIVQSDAPVQAACGLGGCSVSGNF